MKFEVGDFGFINVEEVRKSTSAFYNRIYDNEDRLDVRVTGGLEKKPGFGGERVIYVETVDRPHVEQYIYPEDFNYICGNHEMEPMFSDEQGKYVCPMCLVHETD